MFKVMFRDFCLGRVPSPWSEGSSILPNLLLFPVPCTDSHTRSFVPSLRQPLDTSRLRSGTWPTSGHPIHFFHLLPRPACPLFCLLHNFRPRSIFPWPVLPEKPPSCESHYRTNCTGHVVGFLTFYLFLQHRYCYSKAVSKLKVEIKKVGEVRLLIGIGILPFETAMTSPRF